MRLGNRHRAPTALGALLIFGAALVSCDTNTDQGEPVGGTAAMPDSDRATPGRSGTTQDVAGVDRGEIPSSAAGNRSHEPTGTYLDPAPIDSPGGGPANVEIPGFSGEPAGAAGTGEAINTTGTRAVGAAGAANAQGAAVGASDSPEQAAGTGGAPAGSNAGDRPDETPTDDPVDARP